MKRLCLLISFIVSSYLSFSQTASATWSVKFANAISTRWTTTASGGRVCIDKMTGKGWEYSNAIVLHGIEKVYNQVNTTAYRTYIKTYVDAWVNSSGVVTGQTINSLDRLHPAILLLFLYQDPATNATDKARYKTSADSARNFLVGPKSTYPKTANGGVFWHKNNGSYNDIILLDGIYMAHPFLAKYGRMFNDNAAIDTAVNQTLRVYNQLYDGTTHLIKHAWNPTKTQTWANASGNSTSVWSRAMGWFVMALVDELKYVPSSHPKRAQLITALDNLAVGIKNYQDPTSKLWYQVVDKTSATLSGNYIETSGSAMFVYALKTASDSGWISSATYLPVAQSAWNSLKLNKISINGDGGPQINDFAPAMGVQTSEANYVQASLQGVDCPSDVNPHGYAAILMAASAMEFPLTVLPVKFTGFTAKDLPAKTRLTWQVGDESDVTYYEVQKSTSGTNFKAIGQVSVAGRSTYSFDDNIVEGETANYRINAVNKDNSSHYSIILSVRRDNHGQTLEISPNPVRNGELNAVTTNFPTGKYDVYITSATGNNVYKTPLTISGETSAKRLQLPRSIAKGIYYVRLSGHGLTVNKNVVIE